MRNVLLAVLALTLVTGCGSKASAVLAPNNRAIEIAAKGVALKGAAAKAAAVTKLVQSQQTFEVAAASQQAFETFVSAFFAKRETKYKLIRLAQHGESGASYGLAIEGTSAKQVQGVFGEFATAWQTQKVPAAPTPSPAAL